MGFFGCFEYDRLDIKIDNAEYNIREYPVLFYSPYK